MANPVTDVTRPIVSILQQAADACNEVGVPTRVYSGTSYSGLASEIPSLMVEAKGAPAAVVCYGGSEYGNSPRRTSRVVVLIIQGHTRVSPGALTALTAAETIIAALDDQVYQNVVGEYLITDKWSVADDEAIDIDGIEAAACVVVTFNVEDY